jgi:hypothetical protein
MGTNSRKSPICTAQRTLNATNKGKIKGNKATSKQLQALSRDFVYRHGAVNPFAQLHARHWPLAV